MTGPSVQQGVRQESSALSAMGFSQHLFCAYYVQGPGLAAEDTR
jgi:hypothetical protein